MLEKIKYSFNVQIADGPTEQQTGTLEVQAYEVLSLDIPRKDGDKVGQAKLAVQPQNTGAKLLLITANKYSDVTYKVNNGGDHHLDSPLLLTGQGAVQLLSPLLTELEFSNTGTEMVTVSILVGWDTAPPAP